MRMRRDFTVGIVLAASAIPYGAAMMAAPEYLHLSPSAAFAFFWGGIVGTVILISLAVRIALRDDARAPMEGHARRMIPIIGMIVFGAGFIGCAAWYFWPSAISPPKAATDPFNGLEDLYAGDFPDVMSSERKLTMQAKNEKTGLDTTFEIRFRLYQDFRSHSDFVSIYIPLFHDARMDVYDTIQAFRDQIASTHDDLRSTVVIGAKAPGAAYTDSRELTFSGRVFIYTLNQLTPVQIGNLVTFYNS